MSLTIEDAAKSKILKDAGITKPRTLYSTKIASHDLEIEKFYTNNRIGVVLLESWNKQHPLIHTWLLLSCVSICFLSALFFVFP